MIAPERDKDGYPIVRVHAISSPVNEHARLTGTHDFTIAANSTAQDDYTLAADRLLDGIKYKVDAVNFADKITLQVVHPIAGVIDEFGKDWPACDREVIRLYRANLVTGLILRVIYTNTGASPVRFIAGMFLHEEIV